MATTTFALYSIPLPTVRRRNLLTGGPRAIPSSLRDMTGATHYAMSIPLSVAPVLALLWLFRWLDKARPVPRRWLYLTMGLGALVCAPAALAEWLAHAALGDASLVGDRFVDAFVVTALTEEALKLGVVLCVPFRRSAFEEVFDGVVYTVAASLGFGLLENLAYSATDVATGFVRALTAVPMHAIASGVMGYFVGRARFVSASGAMPLTMTGLFFGVLIHGSYDWAVFNSDRPWFAGPASVLVVSAGLLATLCRQALRMDDLMQGRHLVAPFVQPSWPTNVPAQAQTIVPSTLVSNGRPEEPDKTPHT